MDLKTVQDKVREFTEERAWDIILPSQRVAHLAREVGKLSEYILFDEGVTTKETEMKKLPKQLGDVLFSLTALANLLEYDLSEQIEEAMKQDAIKYPVEETKEAAIRAYSDRTKPLLNKILKK